MAAKFRHPSYNLKDMQPVSSVKNITKTLESMLIALAFSSQYNTQVYKKSLEFKHVHIAHAHLFSSVDMLE